MCGIAGITSDRRSDAAGLMIDRLRHRGPDDHGSWRSEDGLTQLAHRRLSILDLSAAGHQPMASPDGKVCLVYNGEIYNYPERARELRQAGVSLTSSCDTEAVLHLYLRHGVGCFERLEGMFAIALYDQRSRRLILARDRLGKKPLYWYWHDGVFAFASEASALHSVAELDTSIDPHSLLSYLQFDYVPTPGCIFQHTHKLLPGHYLSFENGKVRSQPYWQLDPGQRFQGGYDEARQELDQRLDEATRCRLLADVPVGVFLSGGLDSSTVAYYAARHHAGIETFSIGFEDASYDESSYARQVGSHLGTTHHEWIVTATDMIDALQSGGPFIDEPLGDSSIIPTYLLAVHAREHVTVALGGDGGDELFAGYPTFLAEAVARRVQWLPRSAWKMAEVLADVVMPPSTDYLNRSFAAKKFLAGMRVPSRLRHQSWLGSFSLEAARSLLHPDLRHQVEEAAPYAAFETWEQQVAGWGRGNDRLYEYLRTYLMDEVMVKVDRASMAVSLEARSPLLDHRVVELLFSLPYEWKFRRGRVKHLLKELMRPRLPVEVIDRPKKGFGMPVAEWLRGELSEWVRAQLRGLDRVGILPEVALSLHDRHSNGSEDLRKPLWNLIALSQFVKLADDRRRS